MILSALRAKDCRLVVFESHARRHVEHCPIMFKHTCKVDRIAVEDVHWTFDRNLLGPLPSISFTVRFELLGLETLRLFRVKLNLAFLFNL